VKSPTLNRDARAVLLAAVLPSDELPAAFIRVAGEVRDAQFAKGRARLEEMGLLVGDTFNLTDEGLKLARELQENEARLHAGIPYAERDRAARTRGGKEIGEVVDKWQACTLDGQPAYTNGFILLLGYPPNANRVEKPFAQRLIQAAWSAGGEAAQRRVYPVAYSEVQGWKSRAAYVYLDDATCVDAGAFAYISRRVEGAAWAHERQDDRRSSRNVVNVYSHGRRVGMVMPYFRDAPEEAAKLIAAARDAGVGAEQLSSAWPDAERLRLIGRNLHSAIKRRASARWSDCRFHLCAGELAARVGKSADMLETLGAQPELCFAWLAVCWTGLDAQVKACTGRARAEWIAEINGSEEVAGERGAATAAEAGRGPYKVKPTDAGIQLPLVYEQEAA
jgi:hypothetical protein